ncbi:hypothetical protein AXG93_3884s1050 [Marchantia polymorpha subsp. ruderalis]|uniref:Uncharacterized protein n=1 Tax=Marchantia polymorpha subsp. ruderalis TaxID=1480154 RepID=A0A176W9C9_MARPO|nr:hypothetical protein AXG93_3884s1050 [Marchantia polymorpha subsp. ruderalis]
MSDVSGTPVLSHDIFFALQHRAAYEDIFKDSLPTSFSTSKDEKPSACFAARIANQSGVMASGASQFAGANCSTGTLVGVINAVIEIGVKAGEALNRTVEVFAVKEKELIHHSEQDTEDSSTILNRSNVAH